MPAITPEKQLLFKTAILNYLNGINSLSATQAAIVESCTYGNVVAISAKELAESIKLSETPNDRHLDPIILAILQHLKMDTTKKFYLTNGMKSLRDILHTQTQQDMDFLLEFIDETRPSAHWLSYAYTPTLVTLGILGFSYIEPDYFWTALDWVGDILPVVYQWLYHHLIQLNNWPIIGMGLQIAWLIYYTRDAFRHGYNPSPATIHSLTYRALALMFTFLAHLLTFYAAGTLAWGPALLFFAASFVGIIEHIHFYGLLHNKRKTDCDVGANDVHTVALNIRYKITQDRNYSFFIVRLIHSIAVTALLLICTLLPPNLILTIIYTLSFSLAMVVRDYCIEVRRQYWAEVEQNAAVDHYNVDRNQEGNILREQKIQFRDYASRIIESYSHDRTRQELLKIYMDNGLNEEPFVLNQAIILFNNSVDVAEKMSPTPGLSERLSQSIFALHGTKYLNHIHSTPIRGNPFLNQVESVLQRQSSKA